MMQPIRRRSLVKVFSVFIVLLLTVKGIVCNGEGDILIEQKENVSLITAGPTIAAISSFSFDENGSISLNVLIIAPGGSSTKRNEEMQVDETANYWGFSDNTNTQYCSEPKEDHVRLCGIFLCWDEIKAPLDTTYHKEDHGGHFKIDDGISSLSTIATSRGSSPFHCGLAENNLSHALLYCWGNQLGDGKFLAPKFFDGSTINLQQKREILE